MIHFSINTTVGRTIRFGKFQITTGLHFFIYSHLFLGVHNIEVTVTRFHTHGKLSRITDLINTGLTFLCRYHNYTCHCTGTIYGSSRTVFQYLKTFNIIGIQTGNSRTDQRFRITGRKFVSADFCHILHNNSIYYPQRLRATINRGCSTYTDFGSSTKCSGNILYGNTGRTPFQSTANIRDTIQLSSFSRQFI